MAVFEARVSENAEGKYFVDASCIDCDTCRCISAVHFRRTPERGYSYICKQPSTPAEVELIEEAIECCPVRAIGSTDASVADDCGCAVAVSARR